MKKQGTLANVLKIAAICIVIGGCSNAGKEQVKIAQLQQFLQKDRSPVGGIEYRVLPPDVLAITSYNVPEIDAVAQQIRPDGMISLPLIGDVFVAGLTPQEIRREIVEVGQQYYNKVDVTVYVAQYNSQKIYVFGEVSRPGPLPWTGSDTLLDVMAQVQPTLLAWPERVKVIRAMQPKRGGYIPGTVETENCQFEDLDPQLAEKLNRQGAQELTVDLMTMVKTGDMSHNIILHPDDVIYIPPNPFASVGLALQQVLFPVRSAVDLIQAPGDVDTEYWYWKNRSKTQVINVRRSGSGYYD